jgi:integrase/recombinase XerC
MFEDLKVKFLDFARFERHLSANTLAAYSNDLSKYFDFLLLNKVTDIENIPHPLIIEFLETLFASQSDTSVSRILSTLRSFYKFLLRSSDIGSNPFSKIRNPKSQKKK